MKIVKRALVTSGIALALLAIPMQTAEAFWYGPGYGTWRNSYIWDPAYRWARPAQKNYIRDLYLRGPEYANWRQSRRYGWGRHGWW